MENSQPASSDSTHHIPHSPGPRLCRFPTQWESIPVPGEEPGGAAAESGKRVSVAGLAAGRVAADGAGASTELQAASGY